MQREQVEKTEQSPKSLGKRQLSGKIAAVIRFILLCMAAFQMITGIYQLTPMDQRIIHISFGFVLIFLLYPPWKKATPGRFPWDGILLGVLTLLCTLYA